MFFPCDLLLSSKACILAGKIEIGKATCFSLAIGNGNEKVLFSEQSFLERFFVRFSAWFCSFRLSMALVSVKFYGR